MLLLHCPNKKNSMRLSIVLLIFLSVNSAVAQHDSTLYFNSDWRPTTKDSAAYYREATYNKFGKIDGDFTDYYMSGKLQNKGEFINGKKDGHWTWYYENGKKKKTAKYVDHEFVLSKTWSEDGICTIKKGTGFHQSHFDNGMLQSEGNYLKGFKEGKWTYYFNNGKIRSSEFFKSGIKEGSQVYLNIKSDTIFLENFSRGKRSGEWIDWHPNKSIKSINHYSEGKQDGYQLTLKENGDTLKLAFYVMGKIRSGDSGFFDKDFKRLDTDSGAAFYSKIFPLVNSDNTIEKVFFISGRLLSANQSSKKGLNGTSTRWYENGHLQYKANFKDGKVDGTVESFFENGNPRRRDSYKDGELVKGNMFSISGSDTAHSIFRFHPEFPGGTAAMYTFIHENIKYPEEARAYQYTGTIYVTFLVDTGGQITNVEVINKNVNEECLNNAALNAVKKMPKWLFSDDAPTPTYFTLPIAFKLQ